MKNMANYTMLTVDQHMGLQQIMIMGTRTCIQGFQYNGNQIKEEYKRRVMNGKSCGKEKLKNRRVSKYERNDKKCINKEERVRHLPGYCPQTSQETKDAEER